MVSRVTDTYDPNTIFAGNFPREGEKVTLLSGNDLAAGALLGRITASGKWTLAASAASDGSAVPRAVLAEACDASGGDAEALVYFSGTFDATRVSVGAGYTAATAEGALRANGVPIFLRDKADK